MRFPPPGGPTWSTDLEVLAGGCAANTASVLAKFGASTALVALIGRDALGDAVLADLAAVGVQTDTGGPRAEDANLRGYRPGQRLGRAIVLLSQRRKRTFGQRPHPGRRLARMLALVHVGGAMKLVNLDLADLTRRAKSFGCLTSLDTDWDVFGNWMQRLRSAPCRTSTI